MAAAQIHAAAIDAAAAANAAANAAASTAANADTMVASFLLSASDAQSGHIDSEMMIDPIHDADSVDAMSVDPIPDVEISDAMSPSTVGSMGMSEMHVSERLSITTAAITKYPHFFLKVLHDALREIEEWNEQDAAKPAETAEEVTFAWTRSKLKDQVPDFQYLNYRQRTRLTRVLMKLINTKKATLDVEKLPYKNKLTQPSTDAIDSLFKNTRQLINDKTFKPEVIIARPAIRLFALVPAPSFRLRYIHLHHRSIMGLLKFSGLSKYQKDCKESAPDDGEMHLVFHRLFDWTRIRP